MQLPAPLRHAIEQETQRINAPALAKAATELSDRYRNFQRTADRLITTEAQRLAYAAVRMPATYAAARTVLTEVQRRLPHARMESLLDLGAGTGAATWAAMEGFEELQQATLLEQDGELIALGQRLMQAAESETAGVKSRAERELAWRQANLRTATELPAHDLVVCSYALGELGEEAARRVARLAWAAARVALVLIEPGTTPGFALIRQVRADLIAAGAHLLAPCPHARACPMPPTPPTLLNATPASDWCHFAARVERSALHRRLKAGALSYEDEKFSYVACTKAPVERASARVLRHPAHHPGRAQLRLCAEEGLRDLTITKRDGEAWRRARKTEWGDAWE